MCVRHGRRARCTCIYLPVAAPLMPLTLPRAPPHTVWDCMPDGRVACRDTTVATDCLLCGLTFCQDTLAATAYDTPNIYAWTL